MNYSNGVKVGHIMYKVFQIYHSILFASLVSCWYYNNVLHYGVYNE